MRVDALEAKILRTIRGRGMIARGDRVLLAVSGGADSTAMLHALESLRRDLGADFGVAHVEHGLRGEESQGDARFVAELAAELGLPFYLHEARFAAARAKRFNLEAAAREERYRFFAALALEEGFCKVATAHTRDDQAETVLMWLVRGAGRKGLSGIPPVRALAPSVALVRPMIETSRAENLAYLARRNLVYREDSSNRDTSFLRNWIRRSLIPAIESRTGAGLRHRLARAAALVREEEEILDALSRERLSRAVADGKLLREELLAQPRAVQRRMLRLWLEQRRGGLGRIGLDHVERALEFIAEGPAQGAISLPTGWELLKEYGRVSLEPKGERRQGRLFYSYLLPLGAEIHVPEAEVRLRAYPVSGPIAQRPGSEREALFDSAVLAFPLIVRNFRPGDRIQPLGMEGHKKVKDLFIEKKVPLSARRVLPLLVCGKEILWIPGCGRSNVARILPATRQAVAVEVRSAGS